MLTLNQFFGRAGCDWILVELHYDFLVLHLYIESRLENFDRLSDLLICLLETSHGLLVRGVEIVKVSDLAKDRVTVDGAFFVELLHFGLHHAIFSFELFDFGDVCRLALSQIHVAKANLVQLLVQGADQFLNI